MTVRVNKSAFNIREKLSELERPIGVKGNELMRAETLQDARDLVSAGRKNLIINGAMMVSQRTTSSSTIIGSGYRALDRWKTEFSGYTAATGTISQSSESPPGFNNSLRVNITGPEGLASGDLATIRYRIEAQDCQQFAFGTSQAKILTLSFWIRSSVTGTYTIGLYQTDDNRHLTLPYTVDNADTWEYKVITIPPDTTGVIDDDNGEGLQISWNVSAGGNYNATNHTTWGAYANGRWAYGQTADLLGVASNLYLTGVQLEVGKNATEFEHRSYGEELALCERYFEKIWQNNNTASPHSGGDGYNTIATGAHNGTYGYYVWKFRTQKRIRPSLDHAGKFRVLGGSSISDLTFNEFYSPGIDAARIRSAHSGSAGQAFVLEFDGGNSSIGYISANAEL